MAKVQYTNGVRELDPYVLHHEIYSVVIADALDLSKFSDVGVAILDTVVVLHSTDSILSIVSFSTSTSQQSGWVSNH